MRAFEVRGGLGSGCTIPNWYHDELILRLASVSGPTQESQRFSVKKHDTGSLIREKSYHRKNPGELHLYPCKCIHFSGTCTNARAELDLAPLSSQHNPQGETYNDIRIALLLLLLLPVPSSLPRNKPCVRVCAYDRPETSNAKFKSRNSVQSSPHFPPHLTNYSSPC